MAWRSSCDLQRRHLRDAASDRSTPGRLQVNYAFIALFLILVVFLNSSSRLIGLPSRNISLHTTSNHVWL